MPHWGRGEGTLQWGSQLVEGSSAVLGAAFGKKGKPLETASTDVPVQHGDLGSGVTI